MPLPLAAKQIACLRFCRIREDKAKARSSGKAEDGKRGGATHKTPFSHVLQAMQNFLSQATATVEAKFAAELEAKRLREEAERQQFEELTRQQAMEELLQEAEGLLDGGDLQEYVDEHLADRIADRIVEEHEIREAAR